MRYKLDSMLPEGAFSPETRSPLGSRMRLHGGDGGGGPTTTTTNTSNVPEYARPFVEKMLGSAEKQMYVTGPDGKETFREYVPFSKDPRDYFAGPTTAQTQAYNQAMGLRSPYQFDQASGQARRAGQMGLRAQRDYQRGATNPGAIGAYMSPYMQNAVDVQKQQANRDYYQTQLPNLSAQAAKAGAFGGSRHGVAQAMAQQDLNRNLQNIQATGTDKAFEHAQRAHQFGADLGVKGAQLGNAAAQNLANIGNQQQQANLARIGMLDNLGSKQQQFQQGIINQQIQNYATQQQYPYMQLAMMNALTHGLPMQGVTTQSYQASNPAAQAAGMFGAGLGAYKAFGSKDGGLVPGYAGGGVPNTAGVANAASTMMSDMKIKQTLRQQPIQYLQMLAQKLPPDSPLRDDVAAELALRQRLKSVEEAQTPRGIGALDSGIGRFHEGGIIGFNSGGGYTKPHPGHITLDPSYVPIWSEQMDALRPQLDEADALVKKLAPAGSRGAVRQTPEQAAAYKEATERRDALQKGWDYITKEAGLTTPAQVPMQGGLRTAPTTIENPTATQQTLTIPGVKEVTKFTHTHPKVTHTHGDKDPKDSEITVTRPTLTTKKLGPIGPGAGGPSIDSKLFDDYLKQIKDDAAANKKQREQNKWLRVMEAGLGVAATSNPNFLQTIAMGSGPALQNYIGDVGKYAAEDRTARRDAWDIAKAREELITGRITANKANRTELDAFVDLYSRDPATAQKISRLMKPNNQVDIAQLAQIASAQTAHIADPKQRKAAHQQVLKILLEDAGFTSPVIKTKGPSAGGPSTDSKVYDDYLKQLLRN